MYDSIVGQHLELRGREKHGEEPVVLLVPRMRGVVRRFLPCRAAGGCGAVVTVGDVGDWHALEAGRDGRMVYGQPDGVPHTILGCQVIEGGLRLGLCDELVDGGLVAVGQEDGTGVGVQFEDVPRAVVLLVLTRLFMLQDGALFVFIDVGTCHDPGLRMSMHDLSVDIDGRARLALENAVTLQVRQILRRFGVDGIGMHIRSGGQVDFGADHVQETVGVPRRKSACLVRINGVIRHGGDSCDMFGGGA